MSSIFLRMRKLILVESRKLNKITDQVTISLGFAVLLFSATSAVADCRILVEESEEKYLSHDGSGEFSNSNERDLTVRISKATDNTCRIALINDWSGSGTVLFSDQYDQSLIMIVKSSRTRRKVNYLGCDALEVTQITSFEAPSAFLWEVFESVQSSADSTEPCLTGSGILTGETNENVSVYSLERQNLGFSRTYFSDGIIPVPVQE